MIKDELFQQFIKARKGHGDKNIGFVTVDIERPMVYFSHFVFTGEVGSLVPFIDQAITILKTQRDIEVKKLKAGAN
jgi:hypothetical protein